MKKFLFLMGAGLAMLASCTNEEITDIADNRAIGFDAFVNKTTKSVNATQTTLDGLKGEGAGFYVYGSYKKANNNAVEVFKGTHVFHSTNSWTYSPTQYWVEGGYYKLLAYAPEMGTPAFNYGTATEKNDATLTFSNLTINGNTKKDFVVAKAAGINATAEYNTAVQFTFKHALTKLKVTLRNGFATGNKVSISDFKMNGLKVSGKFTTDAQADNFDSNVGTWSELGNAETQSTFTHAGTDNTPLSKTWATAKSDDADATKAYYYENLVIPQEVAKAGDVSVTFTVNVADAANNQIITNKAMTIKIPAITWALGNAYNYTLTLTGENIGQLKPIVFGEPSISGWTDNNETVTTPEAQTKP